MFNTNDLIPTNGVFVTETYGPKGWLAGRYDHEGFVADQRWFLTREEADAYARQIAAH
jgi:hypothetical protein